METSTKATTEQATSVATPVGARTCEEAHAAPPVAPDAPSIETTSEGRPAAAVGSESALDLSTLRGGASESDEGGHFDRFDDLAFGSTTADVAPATTGDRVDQHTEISAEDEDATEVPVLRYDGALDEGDALKALHGTRAEEAPGGAVQASAHARDADVTDEVDDAPSAAAEFVVEDSAYAVEEDGELPQAVAEPEAAQGAVDDDLPAFDASGDDRMLDDELAGFQLQPEEVAAVPAPIEGIDALAAEVRNAEPIEVQVATSPRALAQGEAELQDFLARSQSQLHVLATLDMVARRVRGGEIAPAVDAGASPEAVLASVLAAILSPRT